MISTKHSQSISRGRSLLELMVGLALGLIVILIASTVYTSTVSATRATEVESKLNENAAVVLGILQQQIRLAGYSTIVGSPTYSIRKNFVGEGARGCSGGFTGTLTVPYGLITCANVVGSTSLPDSLVVRYEANVNNTIPVGAAPQQPSNCIGNSIASSTPSDSTSTAIGATALPNYALAENRYYVRTTGTPSGSPELYCLGLTGPNTFSTPYPIAEGVEYMQFTYGVANTTTGTITTAYMSALAIDTQLAAEAQRWERVISIRICLVIRSTDSADRSSRATDSNTNNYFDCSNNQVTSNDGRYRRAYTTTVLLKNKISKL